MTASHWTVRGVKIYYLHHDREGTWGLGVSGTPDSFNITLGRTMVDFYWNER